MEYITPTTDEINNLNGIPQKVLDASEMSPTERNFLNSLILRYKPQKILEIGVAAGASSAIILNAIKNIPDAKLFSVDLNTKYYRNNKLSTGYIVDLLQNLKSKWELYTGELVYNFIDTIGENIDFCLIDTVHMVPGEILDFLSVYPYLKNNCIVVLHDITFHTWMECQNNYVNGILYSCIEGKKIIPDTLSEDFYYTLIKRNQHLSFPNIGAVVLEKDLSKDALWNIINLLTLEWRYQLSEKDIIGLNNHFGKFFTAEDFKFYNAIVNYQHGRHLKEKKASNIVKRYLQAKRREAY
jgi:predicted O-methyltransferase YrrM